MTVARSSPNAPGLTPEQIGERLQLHLAAARAARGRVVKGDGFYGAALRDERVCATVRSICLEAGFAAEFTPAAIGGGVALTVWEM